MEGMCRAVDAPRHGTAYAYRRYRCRCTAAVRHVNDRKRRWEQETEKGRAWVKERDRRRRAARRPYGGLTSAEHFRQQARQRAHAVLAGGGTQVQAAHAAEVDVRTIQRWVAKQRVDA